MGFQHLDRHLAIVAEIARDVDRGHATMTQLSLDDVSIRDGCTQSGAERHRWHPSSRSMRYRSARALDNGSGMLATQ